GGGVWTREWVGKRLRLMRDLLARAAKLAALGNPTGVIYELETKDLQQAADAAGLQLLILEVTAKSGFEAAFALAEQQRSDGLFVSADAFFTAQRNQIIELAARHRLPAPSQCRDSMVAAVLM